MNKQVLVLLAEDEELIRLMIAEHLRDEGFEVVEVEHAEAALAALQDEGHRFHLLFTDVHMPGTMNGIDLAHHAARTWPWISLLITSGRPAPEVSRLPANCRFLSKPYRLKHVTNHIQEMTAA